MSFCTKSIFSKNLINLYLNWAVFASMIFMLLSSSILSYLYSGFAIVYAVILTELFSFIILYYFIYKK